MLNLDMVGRMNDDSPSLNISGTGTAKEFETMLNAYKDKLSFAMAYSPGGYGASDQASFYGVNIPVLFFNTGGHDDYHTPLDDVDKINFKKQQEIVRFVYNIAVEILKLKEPLTFVQVDEPFNAKKNTRGFKVTLGVIPDYGGESKNGMRVDGVKKGGPAEKGGIIKNDVITAINGKSVSNIYDYMERLGELKAGDVISVDVLRDGKKVVLIIKL
jgi:hypothetical protein